MKVGHKKRSFFRLSVRGLIISSIFVITVLASLVLNNKVDFGQGFYTNSLGKRVRNPFSHVKQRDMMGLGYTYNVPLKNSFLFCGELHIIPTDCIEKICIGRVEIDKSLFFNRKCDSINGFYIDISSLLQNDKSVLQVNLYNSQRLEGMRVYDVTFYEKYILIGYVLFLVSVFRFGIFYRWTSIKLYSYFSNNLLFVKAMTALIILFLLSLGCGSYFPELQILFWLKLILLIFLVACPIIYWLCKSYYFDRDILWLGLIWIAMFICYFLFLSHNKFAYDYQGHIDYVQYVVTNGNSPRSEGGWSFYHPSLYYRTCAAVLYILHISDQIDKTHFFKGIQATSLLLFLIYCYWSVKSIVFFYENICRPYIHEKSLESIKNLSLLLFLCWPSNSMVSVRIGNDVLFDMLFSMSFYFLLRWWYSSNAHTFFLSVFCAALCVWSKTNGFILFGIIGSSLFFRILGVRCLKYWQQLVIFILMFGLSLNYFFISKTQRNNINQTTFHVVENANNLGDDLKVGSHMSNFMSFDFLKFVEIPFTDPFDDDKGRDSFGFYLLKTSMFGEFTFKSDFLKVIAQILSALILILIIISIIGVLISAIPCRVILPILLNFILLLISMVIFRALYSYSCSGDFRYIFPAVLPGVIFFGLALGSFIRYRRAFYTAQVLCLAFIWLSLAFQGCCILIYGSSVY